MKMLLEITYVSTTDYTRAVLSSSRRSGADLSYLAPETQDFTMQHYTRTTSTRPMDRLSTLPCTTKTHALPHQQLRGQTQQVPPKHQHTCANYTVSRVCRQVSQPTLPSLRSRGEGRGLLGRGASNYPSHLQIPQQHRDIAGSVTGQYRHITGTVQGQYLNITGTLQEQ